MSKVPLRLTLAVLAIILVAWLGRLEAQQDGPLNEAGRAVKRGLQTAGQAVSGGLQTAGQAVSGGFQKTRTSVHNMEVVSRVYSRLHWDKAMTGSTVEIEVKAGGIAILTGIVPSEDAKAKALSLTAETVGVDEVVDQLAVATVTRASKVIPGVVPPPVTVPPRPSETDTPL